MKHIIKHIDENIYQSKLLDFYFEGMSIGALDIESTGLSASRNKFILGGVYNFKTKEFHQFFAQDQSEEAQALFEYVNELSKLDVVITYNGKHFDIPFINARYQHCFGKGCLEKMPFNFDIYLMLNGHSPIKQFVPNLKQKTIENYLGLWHRRTDEISGAESVDMFIEYQKSKDPDLERQILLHNSDDVLQLTRILRVVSKCDFHKAMQKCGFPAGRFSVQKTLLTRDQLKISGNQRGYFNQYIGYNFQDLATSISLDGDNGQFNINIPITRYNGMSIVDLHAAGINTENFKKYPSYDSGLLAIEVHNKINHMELNHFIIEYIKQISHLIGEQNGFYR